MRLPFKDAAFDKIICSEVLEHLADDGQGIREMRRVLKDDGALAISVPSYLPEAICWRLSRGYHNKPGGHVRKYRASELMAALRQNNLSIYATRRKHALHSFYWVARCLFGIKNERAWLPSLFHRFLVWDIETKSKPVRLLEGLLNPPFSKSTVFYTRKNHIQGKGA
jgi:SAM-dependent methyltransferase